MAACKVAQRLATHLLDYTLEGDKVQTTVAEARFGLELALHIADMLYQPVGIGNAVLLFQLAYRRISRQARSVGEQVLYADSRCFSIGIRPVLETRNVKAYRVEQPYLAFLA